MSADRSIGNGRRSLVTGAAVSAVDSGCVYPTVSGASVHALGPFTLDVMPAEFVAIIGPSGCGKSTFLRSVADLHGPGYTRGKLSVCGVTPEEARRSRRVGFMFQQPALLPWRTVIDNVRLPLQVAGIKDPPVQPQELVDLVGLTGFEDALPRECSGGMRQRAAMARSLMLTPSVLLLDEPFASVDEITRDRLNLALQDIWTATRPAVLYVTHSLTEAVFLADRVIVMSARPGRVAGTVDVPFERPRPLDLRATIEFLEVTNRVRDRIQQEAETAESTSIGGKFELRGP